MISSKSIQSTLSFLLLICFFAVCTSCGGENNTEVEVEGSNVPDDFTVRILLRGNTDGLNTLLAQSANSTEILDNNVHAGMLELDPKTFELIPYLAKGRPEIKIMDDETMQVTFEIREEAVWDNGTPITAEDYAFTIKAIKNPKTNASTQRPFVEFIEEVVIDENNPKKFTVICNKRYLLVETVTGTLSVLPAYFYDEQGLMSEFSISELNNSENLDRLNADPRINDFAKQFNNDYNHEPTKVVGAGPYQVTEIETHQHVVLERKKDWWGDNVNEPHIAAYPDRLFFKIIDDDNNAILSLKEQELDVMTYIPAESFLELQENDRAKTNFNLSTVNGFAYRYLGMNMKSSRLNDVRVRKAIAHLVDKQVVAEELCSNLATPVNGPISPLKSYYNKNIPTINFDVDKAKALLAEAGWKDMDGDNILDKMIDGQQESLSLKFLYPQGKQFYRDLAQVLKDEASRVGIDVRLAATEWSVMLEDMKKRDFDLICLGWGQTPVPDDLKQIWHSSSDTYDGSNTVGFGSEESDRLIDEIRECIDESKRNEMYLRFQELVAEEHPYVFLVAPKMCNAISKRFSNAESTPLRPGYKARLFQLAK